MNQPAINSLNAQLSQLDASLGDIAKQSDPTAIEVGVVVSLQIMSTQTQSVNRLILSITGMQSARCQF